MRIRKPLTSSGSEPGMLGLPVAGLLAAIVLMFGSPTPSDVFAGRQASAHDYINVRIATDMAKARALAKAHNWRVSVQSVADAKYVVESEEDGHRFEKRGSDA